MLQGLSVFEAAYEWSKCSWVVGDIGPFMTQRDGGVMAGASAASEDESHEPRSSWRGPEKE